MSSLKKRSKVRRILRTMFGEANVRPIKNGLNALPLGQIGSHTWLRVVGRFCCIVVVECCFTSTETVGLLGKRAKEPV